jgi:hypothetical protein
MERLMKNAPLGPRHGGGLLFSVLAMTHERLVVSDTAREKACR